MKKAAFFALILILTAVSGFSWPWDKPAQGQDESKNPFVGKAFISDWGSNISGSVYHYYLFDTDTGATMGYRTSTERWGARHSGKYSFDPQKKVITFDDWNGPKEYRYTLVGKVLQLGTIDSTTDFYQVPTPPFWVDESGPYRRELKAKDEYLASDKPSEGAAEAIRSFIEQSDQKRFAIIADLIAQAKGAPAATTTPSPRPQATPSPTPVSTPNAPPPIPPPTPAQISVASDPITIVQANGNLGPSDEVVPLDGEYRGVFAVASNNTKHEIVLKMSTSKPLGGSPPRVQLRGNIAMKNPGEEGANVDFTGIATYGDTTTIFLQADEEAATMKIDGHVIANNLVAQVQMFFKNNQKPGFGFLGLEKKK